MLVVIGQLLFTATFLMITEICKLKGALTATFTASL